MNFQYLKDLRDRGVRIIIGEFYESSALTIMCEAYKQGMTQRQGYVWFLPAWYQVRKEPSILYRSKLTVFYPSPPLLYLFSLWGDP